MRILYFFFISLMAYGQDFNGYSHIALLDIEYENNIVDKYQISPTVINFFQKKGFKTLRLDNNIEPYDGSLSENICRTLFIEVNHSKPKVGPTSVNFNLLNCNGQTFLKFSDTGMSFTPKSDIQRGVKKILKKINKRIGKYKFDSKKTPILEKD